MSRKLRVSVLSEPEFLVVRRARPEIELPLPTRSFDMQATAKMLLKDDTKQTPLKGLQTYDDAEKEAAVQEEDLGNMLENLHFRLNEASVPADEEQGGSPSPVAVKVRQGRKTSGAETGQSDHKNSGRKHTTGKMSKSIKQQLGLSDSNSTSDPIFEAFGICDFSDCSTGKYKKDSIFTVHEQLTHKKGKTKKTDEEQHKARNHKKD